MPPSVFTATSNLLELPTAPFLKWLGSKRWAIEIVRPLWFPFAATHRLVDLTLGSGALLLALQPSRFLGFDVNEQLIALWRWVQRDGKFTLPLVSSESYFYQCRDRYNLAVRYAIPDHELPQLLYLLCRTSFNGLHRSSRIKAFNAPWGKYASFTGQTDLSHYKQTISHWRFDTLPYEESIPLIQSDDFVLFDPPYDSENGKGFVGYHGTFTRYNQTRAARLLSELSNPIVAFNLATPFIIDLYSDLGFALHFVDVARSVAADSTKRKPVREVIATKNIDT